MIYLTIAILVALIVRIQTVSDITAFLRREAEFAEKINDQVTANELKRLITRLGRKP